MHGLALGSPFTQGMEKVHNLRGVHQGDQMKEFLLSTLNENSKVSSMRLMSLMCVVSGVAMGFIGLLIKADLIGLAALCSVFIGAGLTGKVAQKAIETKDPNPPQAS